MRGRSFANLRFISFASLFYFVDKGTQSFTIVVSKHTAQTGHMKKQDIQGKERVKKPYENQKVTKQYKGKDYKTISISFSSVSISLHSEIFINAQVPNKRKREVGLVILVRYTVHTKGKKLPLD